MMEGLDLVLINDAGDLKLYEASPVEQSFREIMEKSILIKIIGEINLYSAQHIKELLEDKLNRNIVHLFLELSEVSYIDSSGLGVFLGIHSKVYKTGGGVHLVAPSEKVNYVLVLTKLVGLMKVFPNWRDALNFLK